MVSNKVTHAKLMSRLPDRKPFYLFLSVGVKTGLNRDLKAWFSHSDVREWDKH